MPNFNGFRGCWPDCFGRRSGGWRWSGPGAGRAQQGVLSCRIEKPTARWRAETARPCLCALVPNVNAFRGAGRRFMPWRSAPTAPPTRRGCCGSFLGTGAGAAAISLRGHRHAVCRRRCIPVRGRRRWPKPGSHGKKRRGTAGRPCPVYPEGRGKPHSNPVRGPARNSPFRAPEIPEETPQQARQSEAQLDRAGRDALPGRDAVVGFYNGPSTEPSGPGTKRRGCRSSGQTVTAGRAPGILTHAPARATADEYQVSWAAVGMETRARRPRRHREIDLAAGDGGLRPLQLSLRAVRRGSTTAAWRSF